MITCFDHDGKPYEVPENEIIDRTAIYGISLKDKKILLVYDKRSKFCEIPGGGINPGLYTYTPGV